MRQEKKGISTECVLQIGKRKKSEVEREREGSTKKRHVPFACAGEKARHGEMVEKEKSNGFAR